MTRYHATTGGMVPFTEAEEAEADAREAEWETQHLYQTITEKRKEISAERDRRLARGFIYPFPDGSPGVVEIRDNEDKTHITGIGATGLALITAGNTEKAALYIDQADFQHWMTGQEAVAFANAVHAEIAKHYAAANAHKKVLATWDTESGAWGIKTNPETGEQWTVEEVQGYDYSGWTE